MPIRVETVAGTLYACLAEDEPDFAPFRRDVEPLLVPLGLADARVAHVDTLVERGGWKLLMENARECHHCDAKHPELSFTFPTGARGNFERGGNPGRAAFDARMAALGLPVGPVDGEWYGAARLPLNAGCASMTGDGRPCVARPPSPHTGGDVGSLRCAVEPHHFTHAVGDFAFMFSAMPTGSRETVARSRWLVHKGTIERVDYELDGLIFIDLGLASGTYTLPPRPGTRLKVGALMGEGVARVIDGERPRDELPRCAAGLPPHAASA